MKPALYSLRQPDAANAQAVSSVPGRLRIRDHALRNAWLCSQLTARLSGTDGVISLDTNSRAGSVTILYETRRAKAETIEAAVDALVAELRARQPERHGKSTQRRLNRAAKVGMIGSLTASMALAATGNKRWHAATGAIFLSCLGVHLAVHRRHLVR
jgi:hypothetical protein